ncbi:MAG: hypothetical protein ACLUTA_12180 [Blautia wexlerae]
MKKEINKIALIIYLASLFVCCDCVHVTFCAVVGIFGTVGFAAEVQTEFNEVKDHASCTDGYEGPEDPFRPV